MEKSLILLSQYWKNNWDSELEIISFFRAPLIFLSIVKDNKDETSIDLHKRINCLERREREREREREDRDRERKKRKIVIERERGIEREVKKAN